MNSEEVENWDYLNDLPQNKKSSIRTISTNYLKDGENVFYIWVPKIYLHDVVTFCERRDVFSCAKVRPGLNGAASGRFCDLNDVEADLVGDTRVTSFVKTNLGIYTRLVF